MSNPSRSPYAQEHWQRWEMDAFELPPDPSAPEPEPEINMETVLAEIADLKELTKKQAQAEGYAAGHEQGLAEGRAEGLKTGFEDGLKKGTEQGYTEGYAKGNKTSLSEATRLATVATTTTTALNALHEDLGQAVLALAVDIAQHILQTELQQHPEQLLPVIKNVLKEAEQTEQAVTIVVNPADMALLEQQLADDLEHQPWRLKADDSITAGGAEINTALGQIDATLETRWRRTLSRLGPDLANTIS